MKKTIAMFLLLSCLLSCVSCSKWDASQAETGTGTGAVSETESETTTPKQEEPNVLEEKKYPIKDCLNYLKVHGRTEQVSDGITCDFTAAGIEFSAYVQGKVILEVRVESQGVESAKNDDIYFTAFVDGVRSETRFKASRGTTTRLEIASFEEAGEHTIRILKQSESKNGLCTLKSLTFKGTFLEAPKAADYYIEFIGDSITSGYGNLCTNGTANPEKTIYKDGTQAFAFLTAQSLGTDFSMISCSGVGVAAGWRTMLAKELFSAQSYYRSKTTAYTPTRTPDLVVINLGTNDQSKGVSAESFRTEARALINLVRSTYGENVKIVWAYGMMADGFSAQIKSLIAEMGGAENGLYTVELVRDNSGGASHPIAKMHNTASKQLVRFINNNHLLG